MQAGSPDLHLYANTIAASRFFKTGKGDYAEHDRFLGVPVPRIRALSRHPFSDEEVIALLHSVYNEERMLALLVLVRWYVRRPQWVYETYMSHLSHINNWNLVDASAAQIVGAYLYEYGAAPRQLLIDDEYIWSRRIALVSTWYDIRRRSYDPTLTTIRALMHDPRRLLHTAAGWMLREIDKRDRCIVRDFIVEHVNVMPRVMLRYAIEHWPVSDRNDIMRRER